MTASLIKRLAGCVFGACIAVSSAHAATGNIVFSGAVLESTCSEADPAPVTVNAVDSSVSERRSCGRTDTDSGSSYSRIVTNVSTAGLGHDSLLVYFASYAPAAAGKVVVQTYD